MLEESSGTVAVDKSGCGNNGAYVGGIISNMLPIVPGGLSGNKITNTSYITLPVNKNYYGLSTTPALANKNNSEKSFSLEVWVAPTISNSGAVPLLADVTNFIGLYWDNVGNIVFSVSPTERLSYPVPYSKRALHIVGIYTNTSISIYLDSILVASKNLSNFKFTNESSSFQIGPTFDSNDFFVVDAPAIYRYKLSPISIKRHFVEGSISKDAIQVAYPDEGVLFSLNDMRIRPQMIYTYPKNKTWSEIADGENVYYDPINNYITFYEEGLTGAKSFIYQDSFSIPTEIGLVSSKIEWRNDYGISVRSSVDGVNWISCKNGEAIPQYKKPTFSTSGKLYVEITMSTPDITKFNPRLLFFAISFFSDKDCYADNFGDKISSSNDYTLGSINYPVLSRNYYNGIRSLSPFTLNTVSSVKSVEFFYTPTITGAPGSGLISGTGTGYSWDASGAISKLNISNIYVNGVDRTSATNISSFLVDRQPHHIVIVFSNPLTSSITFNNSPTDHLYNNITIYEKALTQNIVSQHYNLYTGKPSVIAQEPAITMTELAPKYYNNDWVVIQTV